MNKPKKIFDYMSRDYYDNLYGKISQKLMLGESVVLSDLSGCGGKFFLNLFLKFAKEDKLFD